MPFDYNAAKKAGYTDEQIESYLSQTGRSIATDALKVDPKDLVMRKESKPNIVERNLPVITSMLGGTAGPMGTAAGYSMGDSIQEIAKQMRGGGNDIIADLIGKARAVKMTPYGQKRSDDLGLTGRETPEMIKSVSDKNEKVTETKDLNYKNEAINRVTSKEGIMDAGSFLVDNLKESAIAGVTDFIVGKAANKLKSAIGKKFPSYKIKGILPKQISQSADELADESWKPIEMALKQADESGDMIDITEIVDDLNGQIATKQGKFGAGKVPERALNEIEGLQSVVDDLVKTSDTTRIPKEFDEIAKELAKNGIDIPDNPAMRNIIKEAPVEVLEQAFPNIDPNVYSKTVYKVKPNSAQELKRIFGIESFTPTTGNMRRFSGLFERGEQNARVMAGPQLKKAIVSALQKQGLENAEELYGEYALYSNFSRLMKERPLKGALEAGVTGSMVSSLLSLLNAPGPTAAVPIATFAAMTPIGRQIMRETTKAPINAVPPITRATVSSLLNYLDEQR